MRQGMGSRATITLFHSFRTDFPGARLSHRLREKYPQEMTIVLQHQFWDLAVTEHTFEVGLSFSGVPERLLVPFDALTGFFDPSVQFQTVRGSGRQPGGDDRKPRGRRAAPDPEPVELQPKKPVVPVAAKTAAPKMATKPAAEAAKENLNPRRWRNPPKPTRRKTRRTTPEGPRRSSASICSGISRVG